MTRDEFEAVLWRELPAVTPGVVDRILSAADGFAATTAATALDLDARGKRSAIHYISSTGQPACGYGRGHTPPDVTDDHGRVTCGACKRTGPFRNARALYEAVRP